MSKCDFKAILLKLHFGMSVPLYIFCIFSEHLFPRTPLQSCFQKSQTIPCVAFPELFCLSFNENHNTNETKSLKLIEEIIIPYFENERKRLSLLNQEALSIMNVCL